jgi:Predicted transmembrane transcriptional regulator (anti-sigma factor)
MNCQEIANLMDAYLDGELDPVTSQKVEQHLRECGKCEQAYEVGAAMAHAISQTVPYYKAPIELRERIQFSLREAISAPTSRSAAGKDSLPVRPSEAAHRSVLVEMPWSWLALAAAIILAALIVSIWLPRLQQPGADQFLATQLIASHVRSLMADHLTDVASSDQHTVKPWLDAKLDFAAPVPDLSSQGFPLIGGRLDYLDSRSVAALVYQKRKHFINLFIWPTTSGAAKAQKVVTREGYHLVYWTDADFNYWAVSDVSEGDLQTFKSLFEGQVLHR